MRKKHKALLTDETEKHSIVRLDTKNALILYVATFVYVLVDILAPKQNMGATVYQRYLESIHC